MADKTPEQDGYKSIIVIKEADLRFFADLMTWTNEVWFPENGYDAKEAIVRNTRQGYYEIMAKPKQ